MLLYNEKERVRDRERERKEERDFCFGLNLVPTRHHSRFNLFIANNFHLFVASLRALEWIVVRADNTLPLVSTVVQREIKHVERFSAING